MNVRPLPAIGLCSAALACAGVIVAVKVCSVRQGPNLLKKSMRRLDASGWIHYAFNTDHAVLALAAPDPSHLGFVVVNVDNGGSQPILPDPQGFVKSGMQLVASFISPNGAWVLQQADGFPPSFAARSLRSSGTVKWPSDGQTPTGVEWLSDGSRFVEMEYSNGRTRAVIRDVRKPAMHTVTTLPSGINALYLEGICGSNVAVSLSDFVSVRAKGSNPRQIGVCRFSTNSAKVAPEVFAVSAPRDCDDWYVIPSRSGTKLAIVMDYVMQSHILRWGVPPWKIVNRRFEGLWVSDLNGSNMREIGHYDITPLNGSIHDVQWLPGENALSYIANKSLWTVSVE